MDRLVAIFRFACFHSQQVLVQKRKSERASKLPRQIGLRVVVVRKIRYYYAGSARLSCRELDDLPGAGVGDEEIPSLGLNCNAAGTIELGAERLNLRFSRFAL